jgi:hypothetical protein
MNSMVDFSSTDKFVHKSYKFTLHVPANPYSWPPIKCRRWALRAIYSWQKWMGISLRQHAAAIIKLSSPSMTLKGGSISSACVCECEQPLQRMAQANNWDPNFEVVHIWSTETTWKVPKPNSTVHYELLCHWLCKLWLQFVLKTLSLTCAEGLVIQSTRFHSASELFKLFSVNVCNVLNIHKHSQ